ncbi:MAG: hypothetical protein AB1601_06480 [Planctomycetota bacterium]
MHGPQAWLIAAGLGLISAAAARAEPPPLREARSANGRFTLRIDPGPSGPSGRGCTAVLFGRAEAGAAPQRVWERSLVSDVAPVQVYVRDDGRCVVTLDEHGRGGARHAVVVYGPRGELRRHFLLSDLLSAEDWGHVRREGRELAWLRGARCRFDEAAERFIIELAWDQTIRIDLRSLHVTRVPGSGAVGPAAVPPDFVPLMTGEDDANELDRAVGMSDAAASAPGRPLVEPTAEERARAAAIASELSGGPTSPPTRPPAPAVPEVPAAPVTSSEGPVPDRLEMLELRPPPAPSLVHKADYVAWLNEAGRVSGADATPLYERAVTARVPWTGPATLFNAARNGGAIALEAPEINAWLKANAAALAAFREAARQPERGWSRHSADGTLFGVELPELGPLRELATASVIDGRRLLERGHPREALERYLDVARAGRHLARGVTLVEVLTGGVLQQQSAEAVLDLLRHPRAEGHDFAVLAEELEAALWIAAPLARALEGERALYFDAAQRAWEIDPGSGEPRVNAERVRRLFPATRDDQQASDTPSRDYGAAGFDATVAAGRALFDAAALALNRPYREAAERLREIESIAAAAWSNPLLRGLTPPLARINLVQTRTVAACRAAVLVAHLQAGRAARGEYPRTLVGFAARGFAEDPFAGRPFVYRRQGDGFVLYSVGENGTDDGGRAGSEGAADDLLLWPPP